ncbi:MAG: IS630 family transposase, partial [Saprospiraceae bacterium]
VHGSWLNIAACELSVLNRCGLKNRIKIAQQLKKEVKAWNEYRHKKQKGVDWQFTTKDARIKLKRLYPIYLS